MSLYTFARGGRTVRVFKRQLHEEDVLKASVVMTMGILLCATALFILSITENVPLMSLIVEVCSAFGTTGLSTGVTPDLTTVGKLVLIVLMFIGRVGILTFILASGGRNNHLAINTRKSGLLLIVKTILPTLGRMVFSH